MSYLRRRRARMILAAFGLSSLLFITFPGIDLFVSRLFFADGFYLANEAWTQVLHESVGPFIAVLMTGVIGLYVFNRLTRRQVGGVNGRKVLYLMLVLALGPGLIINATLKDNFGRVRPRDIQEFGGYRHFTPAFVVTDGCKTNCSFSSGDTAGAFFSLALVMALRRRGDLFMAAMGFGVIVSFARIVIGAHYLSDTVVSFFVMLLLSDFLYHYFFVVQSEAVRRVPEPDPVLAMQPVTLSTPSSHAQ